MRVLVPSGRHQTVRSWRIGPFMLPEGQEGRMDGDGNGELGGGALLECVPNVSEGRDAAALRALERALAAVPGVRLLDLAPDADHHRTVVTLAGRAADLCEGVLALFGW